MRIFALKKYAVNPVPPAKATPSSLPVTHKSQGDVEAISKLLEAEGKLQVCRLHAGRARTTEPRRQNADQLPYGWPLSDTCEQL